MNNGFSNSIYFVVVVVVVVVIIIIIIIPNFLLCTSTNLLFRYIFMK